MSSTPSGFSSISSTNISILKTWLSLLTMLPSLINQRVADILQTMSTKLLFLHHFLSPFPLSFLHSSSSSSSSSTSLSPLTRSRLSWLVNVLMLAIGCKQWLLPWLVQRLLHASHLHLLQLDMSQPTLTKLTLHMLSQLSNTGPFQTQLKFCAPIHTTFQGNVVVGLAHIRDQVCVPPHGGQVTMQADMVVKPSTQSFVSEFGGFAKTLVTSEQPVAFELVCKKGLEVSLLNGVLRIPRLTLHKKVELKGMQGLRSIKVVSVTLESATIKDMTLRCVCEITNPSNVSLSLGEVRFSVYLDTPTNGSSMPVRAPSPSLFIGDLVIEDMHLPASTTTTVHAHCFLARPLPDTVNHGTVMDVLSNYLSFQTTPVVVLGQPSKYAYLTPALQALCIHTQLPPLNVAMIQSTSISVSDTNLLARTVQAYLHLTNPFCVPLTLHRMHGKATLASSASTKEGGAAVVGRLQNVHVTMYVPKLTSVRMDDPVIMDLEIGLAQLKAIALSNGIIHVDLLVELDCRVGKCVLNGVVYKQTNVPVHIQLF